MVIATRRMSFQIAESDFDVTTECKKFDDNATISEIKRWYEEGNKKYHFYASSEICIHFVNDNE